MSALLSVERASRRFQGVVAVDGVSLDVQAGELVGIIGPNGAGKTTLFNLISGFLPPTAGRIAFDGRDINGLPAHKVARLGMARTFQNLRTFPNMTVFDNVSIGVLGRRPPSLWRSLTGRDHAAAAETGQRCWEALERVGLADYAGELAANLSYGRCKYLEIARALVSRPKLLILDEPAAGLNDTETAALAAFITRLHAEGTTVLLVEHDMGLVMNVCRRVVVMASGRKIADATPAEVQSDPAVIEAYLGIEEPA